MACCLFGDKLSFETMTTYCQMEPQEHDLVTFELNTKFSGLNVVTRDNNNINISKIHINIKPNIQIMKVYKLIAAKLWIKCKQFSQNSFSQYFSVSMKARCNTAKSFQQVWVTMYIYSEQTSPPSRQHGQTPIAPIGYIFLLFSMKDQWPATGQSYVSHCISKTDHLGGASHIKVVLFEQDNTFNSSDAPSEMNCSADLANQCIGYP